MNMLLVALKRSLNSPKSARPQPVGTAEQATSKARDKASPEAKMKINRLAASIVAAPRRARATAAASLTVLALATTALLAPSASASSPVPGDFSPLIPGNPSSNGWLVDDCYGQLGFVYDPHPATTGFHHIGGVRVNCNSWHSFISATVAMYYWNGSSWVRYGNWGSGVLHNTTGSGYNPGILDTPHYCLYGWRGKWIVGATVSTERYTRTLFTQVPAVDIDPGAC